MATYRIEKRTEGQATEYWDARGDTWDADVEMATVYTEAQRRAALNGWLLPPEGVWVRLDGDEPTHTPAEEEEAAQLAIASGLGISEWPGFLDMAREVLSAAADDNDALPLTAPPYAPESPSQYQQRTQGMPVPPPYTLENAAQYRNQTAPAFTVQHLAIVRQAVAQVIADGDPATPRVDGKPVWSTDWQLYAAGKAESFVEAVTQRVFELATRGDDSNEKEKR